MRGSGRYFLAVGLTVMGVLVGRLTTGSDELSAGRRASERKDLGDSAREESPARPRMLPASAPPGQSSRLPSGVEEAEHPARVESRVAELSEQWRTLEATLGRVPEYDGTNHAFEAKYAGLDPQQLERLYPILRKLRKQEMLAALDDAVASGREQRIVTLAGESPDWARFAPPGSTLHSYASRSEPTGDGQILHYGVSFGPTSYPEVYARILEETWVHDRMDEAGLCQDGEDAH